MAQITMYPAMAGSKRTTLTADLAADGTQAHVSDLSAFPAAPNEVTFQSDVNVWETCIYSAKSAASGAGYLTIARSGTGHDSSSAGSALSWSSGALCSRNPTGYDHNTFKSNIEDLATNKQPLDATLTALAGVTTAAGKYPYFSGVDTAGVLDLPSGYNYIINPCFDVDQQAVGTYTAATTPANSDDTYLMDQWILLSDGNDVVDVSLDTSGAFAGCRCSLKAEVETANKKFGFLQIFESVNSIPFRNQVISVSFKAKTATSKILNNVRCAVLEWTGTVDAVTSDCVDAWGNQGTNPTYVTSWAALNTPANLALTTSEQTFKIENVTVGASCNNLGLFVWVDDTDAAVDDLLYLSAIKFEMGPVATPFVVPRFDEELRKCQRFYWTNGNANGIGGVATSNAAIISTVVFPVTMRATPTITYWNTGIASGHIRKTADGSDIDLGTHYALGSCASSVAGLYSVSLTPFIAGDAYDYQIIANARL